MVITLNLPIGSTVALSSKVIGFIAQVSALSRLLTYIVKTIPSVVKFGIIHTTIASSIFSSEIRGYIPEYRKIHRRYFDYALSITSKRKECNLLVAFFFLKIITYNYQKLLAQVTSEP